MIVLGIDPGVETGIAAWDVLERRLLAVESGGILEVMQKVLTWRDVSDLRLVIFEDARLRTFFGKMDAKFEKYGAAVREGAGSAKRDAAIWEEFCTRYALPFEARRPRNTKIKAPEFQRLTGWNSQTNEHSRDAAMIVHGLNGPMLQGKLLALADASTRPATDRARTGRGKPRRRRVC